MLVGAGAVPVVPVLVPVGARAACRPAPSPHSGRAVCLPPFPRTAWTGADVPGPPPAASLRVCDDDALRERPRGPARARSAIPRSRALARWAPGLWAFMTVQLFKGLRRFRASRAQAAPGEVSEWNSGVGIKLLSCLYVVACRTMNRHNIGHVGRGIKNPIHIFTPARPSK